MNYTFNVYYVDDMQIRLALIMLMERIIHIYSDVEAWYNVQSAAVYNLYPPKSALLSIKARELTDLYEDTTCACIIQAGNAKHV